MYSAEPRARAENSESEWFDELSLIGLSRHFRAVLDQRKLRFEDPRGMGTAIDLGSIDVLRQTDIQKFSSTWLLLGLALVFSAVRILVAPYSFVAAAAGMISIGIYAAFRLPVLAIDHSNGMRHLISGSQSDLLYLYQMLNRVMHGDSISDARRDVKKSWMREEEERIVNSMDERESLQSHYSSRMSTPSATMQTPTMSYSSAEVTSEAYSAPSQTPAPAPAIGSSLPFDASFGFDDANDDGGMQWGMFDDPVPARESVENAVSTEPAAMNGWGTSESQPANEVPPSSSMMLSRATRSYGAAATIGSALPDPTDAAVRDECRPGLVKRARATKVMKSIGSGRSKISSIVSSDKPRNRSWVERMLVPIPSRIKERKKIEDLSENIDQTSRLLSTQRLRLRADHQHQSEVDLGRAPTRFSPETSAQNALRQVVVKKRLEIADRAATEDENPLPRFSELRPSTYGGDRVGIPGVRHLR